MSDARTSLSDTMAAVLLKGHGGLDQLEYRTDVPVPTAGPGEVLINVRAAGVNNTDVNTRIGWYSRSVSSGTDDGDAGATGTEAVDASGAAWSGSAIDFPRIQGADVCTLYLKDLSLLGATYQAPAVFTDLVGYIERDEIRPVIAATFSLDDIAAAQTEFLTKRHVGKIVLVPPPIS